MDPDELKNFYGETAYKDVAIRLATELKSYMSAQGDPLLDNAIVKKTLAKVLKYEN